MRIVVTGTSGQVVTALLERGAIAGHELIALGRPKLDLADSPSVIRELEAAMPDAIISAAAYTAVDKAESESAIAHSVNCEGAGTVAQVAKSLGVPLVHISTDYVFNGMLDRPYREDDMTCPMGVYGASKLAGEQAVLETYPAGSTLLRVAWVYSPFGNNFVKTMLRLARDQHEVSVVADQLGNPTSALDIANGILKVVSNLATSGAANLRGTFHMAGLGEASWADFAEAIFVASAKLGGPTSIVKRITTADYPTPAIRPSNSRLDCARIKQIHGVALPDWRGSLETVIARLQTGSS